MRINWKLRLANKTTLTALIACIVAFIYQLMGIIGIVPSIAENDILTLAGVIINILVALGVVVDPTTSGVSDSTRAMTYEKPRKEI